MQYIYAVHILHHINYSRLSLPADEILFMISCRPPVSRIPNHRHSVIRIPNRRTVSRIPNRHSVSHIPNRRPTAEFSIVVLSIRFPVVALQPNSQSLSCQPDSQSQPCQLDSRLSPSRPGRILVGLIFAVPCYQMIYILYQLK